MEEELYSINKDAERIVGRRKTNMMYIDEPCELGYHCPVCRYEIEVDGVYDERLTWSEYNGFVWCEKCNRDYPSALCMPDAELATDIFLRSVEDAVKRSRGVSNVK